MAKYPSFIKKDYRKTINDLWELRNFLKKNQHALVTIFIMASTLLIVVVETLQSQNDIYYKKVLASSESLNRAGITYSANASLTNLFYLDTIMLGCYDCNDNCSSDCLKKREKVIELDENTKKVYKKVIALMGHYEDAVKELGPIENHNSLVMNILFKIYLLLVLVIFLLNISLLEFKKTLKRSNKAGRIN